MGKRISIISVKAEFITGAGRVRMSAQLAFDANTPATFAKQQQAALDFVGLMRQGGEVHKFDQAITTVKELDRQPAVTAGDDAAEE